MVFKPQQSREPVARVVANWQSLGFRPQLWILLRPGKTGLQQQAKPTCQVRVSICQRDFQDSSRFQSDSSQIRSSSSLVTGLGSSGGGGVTEPLKTKRLYSSRERLQSPPNRLTT